MAHNSFKSLILFLIIFGLALNVQQANAYIVTFDPDNFPTLPRHAHTDLTSVMPGVTLSIADSTGVATPSSLNHVVSYEDSSLATTGSFVFGRSLAALVPDPYWIWDENISTIKGVFRADFENPTSFVSIDMISVSAQFGWLGALGQNGQILELLVYPVVDQVTAAISRPGSDIYTILASAYTEQTQPPFAAIALDNLQFENNAVPTPIPAGFFLMGSGLAALAGLRKKMRRHDGQR